MNESSWFDGPTNEELIAAAEQCAVDREKQLDAVRSALVENSCQCWESLGHSMVGRLVVIAEVIGEDGERQLAVLAPNEQAPWDTAGLVEYARG